MTGVLFPKPHVHAFAYDLLPDVWRCACGEAMTNQQMPPEELFAERAAEARIALDELATLPDDGRAFLSSLRDYVLSHPKLEARFVMVGPDLVIAWRWRS